MHKVMLVIEDYSESMKIQTALKKIGFDILSFANDQRISDNLLTFNPHVLVVSGKVNFQSIQVGIKLKENKSFLGKVILVVDPSAKPTLSDLAQCRVDQILKSPISLIKLIQTIGPWCNMSAQALNEKLERLSSEGLVDSKELSIIRSNDSILSNSTDSERLKKYQSFVQDIVIDTQSTSHSRAELKNKQNELKKGWDFDFLEGIDKLKQQFAKALFNKNK
jgi:hypothetical protein